MKFPKLSITDASQEMYTPPEATRQIIPFLPKNKIIWEMCYWEWHMAEELWKNWFEVVWEKWKNCFEWQPEKFDIIVTNPPYRNNKDFLEKAINSKKPFALLIRLEHLWWVKASKLLKNLDIKILIPEKRISFITPKMREGKKVWWAAFHTIWITYGIIESNKQIIYL